MLDAFPGRQTELTVGPVDGYQPEPGQLGLRCHRNQLKCGAGSKRPGVEQAGSAS
jgi:hypothetical protein